MCVWPFGPHCGEIAKDTCEDGAFSLPCSCCWIMQAKPPSEVTMALLAEELVEEWLNRDGYFTIRGIKLGNDEIDILAIRPREDHTFECRHIEVSVSTNPIGYISKVSRDEQKAEGLSSNSAKVRSKEVLEKNVAEWVKKKFSKQSKELLRSKLFPGGKWAFEFVVHCVKSEVELAMIEAHDVKVRRFPEIVADLGMNDTVIRKASGADLHELLVIGRLNGA